MFKFDIKFLEPKAVVLLIFSPFLFCFSLCAKDTDSLRYPDILKKSGDKYLQKSAPDSALYFYNKALLLMKEEPYNSERAHLFANMGNAYHYMGKVPAAIEYSKKSFVLYEALRDTSGMARSGCDIGFYYLQQYNRTESYEWLTRSLKFAEISKDKLALGKSYSYLAMIYMDIDDNLIKSQEYMALAEKIFIELREPQWLNNVKNEMAVNFQRQGKFEEAIQVGKELQEWCAQNHKVYEEAVVLHNLGYVYTRMNNFKTSIEYYQKAIEKFKLVGDSGWIASEQYSIGLDLTASKKYKEAIHVLTDGLAIVTATHDIETESDIAKALQDVYEKSGNFEEALKFNKRYYLLRDSLNSKEQSEKLLELKTKFETERKDQEIVLLNKDKQIQIADAGKQRQLKNISIAGIIMLLVFSFLLFNRYRIKQKAAEMLEEKNFQIQKEKERAEQSEKYKQDFLANMSHEIRTPMNAIIGLTNLLAGKRQDKQSADYLSAIQHASRNLLRIINDILDLSKLEAGKIAIVKRKFDLAVTCEMIQATFSTLANERKINLEVNNAFTGRFVFGDEGKLIQVLTNLVGNAIKFTERGSVLVQVKEERVEEDGVILKFIVKDTGIGIEEAFKEQIFESFQQAHTGQGRKYGGTGLGLTISKKIVESLGGRLEVSSTPGLGSEFSFSIRLEMTDSLDVNEPSTDLDEKKYFGKYFNGHVKILVAEDNSYNQLVARDTLRKYFPEAEVAVVSDGREVLEAIRKEPFNMIFMDVQMPVMDGFETVRRIRNNELPGNRMIPVIALTASVIQSDLQKCIDEGMNGYIAKPFFETELVDAVFLFSNCKFTEAALLPDVPESSAVADRKYEELFIKIVPQRLEIIEKAIPRGDWRTIRNTIHLMRPQLLDAGMHESEKFFESFETMDGSIGFSEWHSKTTLFCELVRRKMAEMQLT